MPTDLPKLTTEFLRHYNKQQFELQKLRQREPLPNRDDGQLRELREQLEAERRQRDDQKAEFAAALSRVSEELATYKARPRKSEAALKSQVRKSEEQIAAMRLQCENGARDFEANTAKLNEELAACKQEVKELTKTLNELGREPPKLTPTSQKLNDLRKKITKYSARLTELRGFELDVSSRLTSEQLRTLVEALDKELTGMMERYQALSLWEKTDATGGT